jgi:acetylornithine/succinyldiaminopimelate/putrescine aminotransferase
MSASAHSFWPTHSSGTRFAFGTGDDVNRPLDARRCTVQLSRGRLYLDAIASPATALLGHDLPPMPAVGAAAARRLLSSLEPGYTCVAMARNFSGAMDLATRLARSALGARGRVVEVNALAGEPVSDPDVLTAHENETLGRSGRWLASAAWRRTPELVVVGDAIALGLPFGAVLARRDFGEEFETARTAAIQDEVADPTTLARVAAAITTVEGEGLLQHGRELASYLFSRLLAVQTTCPEIAGVEVTGLSFRIATAPPLSAAQVRRGMCERGVLTGVDESGCLAIEPPLPLRIAEADVITGALRGAILRLPQVSASACCASCENTPE